MALAPFPTSGQGARAGAARRPHRNRSGRVADLVEGFETPFGLELLSTAHWVATRRGALSVEDVIAGTYAWNERKRRFSPRQIQLEIFGQAFPEGDTVKNRPFHSYTMKQAIQERFILDVLRYYTPLNSYHRLVKTVTEDPLSTPSARRRSCGAMSKATNMPSG